jgi:hypothetical protein
MKPTLILLLFSCAAWGQNLSIKFYNKTGFDIDSLKIGAQYIGYFKKDASTPFLKYNSFDIQDGAPFGFAFGIIKNKKRDKKPFMKCGYGVTTETFGKYQCDIILMNKGNGYGYMLIFDNHKQFYEYIDAHYYKITSIKNQNSFEFVPISKEEFK